MKRLLFTAASLALLNASSHAEVRVVTGHNTDNASPRFEFNNVTFPKKQDAGKDATFTILSGRADGNGGGLGVLNDGRTPTSEDAPRENFFFAAGTEGGRVLMDLGKEISVDQVNTFSWHPSDRGPQVYTLFGADASKEKPEEGADLAAAGWKRIARVDTRSRDRDAGGQHAASIRESSGPLGKFRYLVFDISRTEDQDAFGNTFYSEIDVIETGAPEEPAPEAPRNITQSFQTPDGKYHFTVDLTAAPDLADWAEEKLHPVVKEWYPKIVQMLPSEGYEAATNVLIRFREDMGGTPASAGGNRVNCNVQWFRRNRDGEAVGSVVHELVHVVQSYGWGRRRNPGASRTPGWVTEGIPDYIRWFLYEPQTKGAEITERNLERARYDGNYRISANFLNWVAEKHGQELIWKVNAAARQGKYSDDLWKEGTGKTIEELGAAWRADHEARLKKAAASEAE